MLLQRAYLGLVVLFGFGYMASGLLADEPESSNPTAEVNEQIMKLDQWKKDGSVILYKNKRHMISAAENGNIEVMKWMAANGDAGIKDQYEGRSLMHYAATKGQIKSMEWLLSQGLYIDVKNQRGSTPLLLAAESGQIEAMKWLVENGADLSIQNDAGNTPRLAAGGKGQFTAVKWLDERGGGAAMSAEVANGYLREAIENNRMDIAKWLLGLGLKLDMSQPFNHTTHMGAAVRQGNIQMAEFLLAHGADINRGGLSGAPITMAKDFKMFRWLVENGVEINVMKDYSGMLGKAALDGNIEVVDFLVKHGADLNQKVTVWTGPVTARAGTPLRLAEEAGQLEMIKWLKANGAK